MHSETRGHPTTYIPNPKTIGELVAALRHGSSLCAFELAQTMKYKDCTLKVVKGTLANLRVELIPENPLDARSSADDRRHAVKAMASILFLTKVAESCRKFPHIAGYSVPLVLESLEGVARWGEHTLNPKLPYGEPLSRDGFISRYTNMTQTFCLLLAIDRHIHAALISLEPFIKLLLKIWVVVGDCGGKQATCGLWALPDVDSFAVATAKRAKQVSEAVARHECIHGFEVYTADFDAGCVARLAMMLDDVSIWLVNQGYLQSLKTLLRPLVLMTGIIGAGGPAVLCDACGLLAGRYIETFVQILMNIPVDVEAENVATLLCIVGPWMSYLAMCKLLLRSQQWPESLDLGEMSKMSSLQDRWKKGAIYHHASHAFHAQYIGVLYRQHMQDIAMLAEEEQHHPNDANILPLFDCRSMPEPLSLWDNMDFLATRGWTNMHPDGEWLQAYLEGHLTELIQMYRSDQISHNLQLVEGFFQQGPASSITLLVMLRDADSSSKAVYSVPHLHRVAGLKFHDISLIPHFLTWENGHIPQHACSMIQFSFWLEHWETAVSTCDIMCQPCIDPTWTYQVGQMPPSNSSFRLNKPLTRKQLLTQVKAGLTAHIWEFHQSFKQEDCSLDLLRATLRNLAMDTIPDIEPRTSWWRKCILLPQQLELVPFFWQRLPMP
ncbi:hypothetical protein FA13DRAFT_1718967 [Coprinellus micaceus]|uniref:Uncharacterized protein n=1 Tax=Coprinellus micaceus TaxID=71717 RepID=A0A4Y7SC80_COPMI|nr:hypothetical protein FA13DRAFT_1718967 [Coprinellus micaceus]